MSWLAFFSKKSPARARGGTYHALLDSTTYAVIALSRDPAVITFLSEWTRDIRRAWSVNYPAYATGFFLIDVPTSEYPEWTWDVKKRVFSPTRKVALTPALREKAALASAKAWVISSIILNINQSRYSMGTGFHLQETVYMTKRLEAQAFRDSGYNEESITEYPYVLHYADFAHIPLKQAADEILFKAKLDGEHLARSERLRMEYLDRVRKTTDPLLLPAIERDFRRDCNQAQLT